MIDYLYIALLTVPIGLTAFNAAFWGGIYKCLCFSEIVMVALAFMLFQAGMLFLGSWTGSSFAQSIGWMSIPIAEAIILLTGLKLIFSAFRIRPEQKSYDLSKYGELIAVSFASSLNAFMIGLGIGLLREVTHDTIAILVVVAGFFTIAGAYFGKKNGKILLIRIAGALAGVLVIALGLFAALNLYEVI